MHYCTHHFNAQLLHLYAHAAIFWPKHDCLIVSDLHLEKGSFLQQHNALLPRYDTHDTLLRLSALITHLNPSRVVCLGDSFHDSKAVNRLPARYCDDINALIAKIPQFVWVLGNHDPAIDAKIKGERVPHFMLDNIMLTHEPEDVPHAQIIGHFHPKMRTRLARHKISGKCFISSKLRLIMPSFGSYTGGLDTGHAVITHALQAEAACNTTDRYLIYHQKVWKL